MLPLIFPSKSDVVISGFLDAKKKKRQHKALASKLWKGVYLQCFYLTIKGIKLRNCLLNNVGKTTDNA